MRNLKKRAAVLNRIAVKRIGKVQATGRQECKLTVLSTKRHVVKEVLSSRMLLAPERVDALEVMVATLGEVEERGIDTRLTLLVASTLKAGKDVATQLNRERLKARGGIANGAGKWQGTMDREQLMSRGHIMERGLLQALRSELGELLVAGRKAFELTKAGRVKSLTKWRRDGRWAKVHAQHPQVGELGARSIIPEEALNAVSASVRQSAQRGLKTVLAAVAAKAGHEAAAVADVSFLGSWVGMEPQAWHLDGEPRLACIIALHDMAATEFVVPPVGFKWKDTLAMTATANQDAFRRRVFALVEADEQSVTGGASVAQVRMAAGDVCFFYTHWLHRAPAPPASAAEGSRVCLFGVFGKKASSEGSPIFRHHYP